MKLFDLLKKDHREVKQLMEQVCEGSPGATKTREKTFQKIKTELTAHSHAEARVFYEPLKEVDESELKALQADVEHHLVEQLLQELDGQDVSEPQWTAKFQVMKELVEHHIEEEEGQIFKVAQKVCDKETLDQIAEQFLAEKQQELQKVA